MSGRAVALSWGLMGSLAFLITFVAPCEFLQSREAWGPLLIIDDANEGKKQRESTEFADRADIGCERKGG